MNKFKQLLRNYFSFSQSETNGFIVLMLLMVLFLFSSSLFSYLFPPPLYQNQSDVLILDSMVNEWKKHLNRTSASLEQVRKDPFPRQFRFDPNTANYEDFSALGFSDIIAYRIIKYREMGGAFLTKRDLLKIFNLPDSQFVKLRDFINLPDNLETKQVQQKDLTSIKFNQSTVPFLFDPNTANYEDF
ncbi:MAG: helix-hairpin-helix domain-containing protein, partial [Bacteroidetes bacterium]|nr:helix-hairpin-helix domain-containing protein [Bacteroidota bacterium]